MDLNSPVFAMRVRIFRASNDVGPLFVGPGFTRILEKNHTIVTTWPFSLPYKLRKKKKKQNEMSFLITW
jgi:hypothetical protein